MKATSVFRDTMDRMSRPTIACVVCLALFLFAQTAASRALCAACTRVPSRSNSSEPVAIGPPSDAIVREWNISPFYRKWLDADGLPILSSAKVSDFALREARYLIDQMLKGRDDIRAAIVRNHVRFVVLAYDEMT